MHVVLNTIHLLYTKSYNVLSLHKTTTMNSCRAYFNKIKNL